MFLYDSLYGYVDAFEGYVQGGGVLFSDYTTYGGTDAQLQAAKAKPARPASKAKAKPATADAPIATAPITLPEA